VKTMKVRICCDCGCVMAESDNQCHWCEHSIGPCCKMRAAVGGESVEKEPKWRFLSGSARQWVWLLKKAVWGK